MEEALFRIAQEALTNVAKYARAGKVTVTLDETCDELAALDWRPTRLQEANVTPERRKADAFIEAMDVLCDRSVAQRGNPVVERIDACVEIAGKRCCR